MHFIPRHRTMTYSHPYPLFPETRLVPFQKQGRCRDHRVINFKKLVSYVSKFKGWTPTTGHTHPAAVSLFTCFSVFIFIISFVMKGPLAFRDSMSTSWNPLPDSHPVRLMPLIRVCACACVCLNSPRKPFQFSSVYTNHCH